MRTARQAFIACMAAVFLTMMGAMGDVQSVGAEISPVMLAAFKAGTVTSVGSTSIGIDGMEYRVKPNAEILDHKGSELKLAEVLVRSEARFHLTKDSEIDMMVVKRPQ
jgi:hypothetical protein